MTNKKLEGISLHPEDAMMNIDALINASLFLSLIDENESAVDILTVTSEYVTAIRNNQNKRKKGGGGNDD